MVHDVRSAHNVGSLLRTADGLGLDAVYMTGFTPYPESPDDDRPPHIRKKMSDAIAKTALGAEKTIRWQHYRDIQECLEELTAAGFSIAALEQTPKAKNISDYKPKGDIALIAGNEVKGLDSKSLSLVKNQLYLPMLGSKESFNVAIAAAIALYHLRYLDKNTS